MAAPLQIPLNRTLTGIAEYQNRLETIPGGSIIEIINEDYSDIESIVGWDGRKFVVDRDTLDAIRRTA